MQREEESYSIIGIDEAGRGPLAGPVYVAGVAIKQKEISRIARLCAPIRGKDSKKLTIGQREEWYGKIIELQSMGILRVAQSSTAAQVIDSIGISKAIKRALSRTICTLGAEPLSCSILLDGSLYAPRRFLNQRTIIKGDENELVIQLASIVAKVTRDRAMVRMAKRFPGYGLEIHKGYGTRKHRAMIQKKGISKAHRRSFCTKL